MKIDRYTVKVVAAAIGIPMLVLFGCGWLLKASLPGPEDVVFSDISAARREAEVLMDAFRSQPEGDSEPLYLAPDEVPAALRIREGISAFVSDDHVSIVLHSNPDFLLGARIWRPGAVPPERDEKTSYRDVTFFSVVKDLNKVGENRL